MNIIAPERMTVEEFLAWSEGRPGRFELLDGRPVEMMSPERMAHVRTKTAIHFALQSAIRERGLDCEAIGDGIGVRITDRNSFEPDCIVYCGPRLADTERYVPNPVIVVEVLSPSTQGIDVTTKLANYFKLASLQHYLIVDADERALVQHRRTQGEMIETRIVREGEITLEPPGLAVVVERLFA